MELIGLLSALGTALCNSGDNLSMKSATNVFPNLNQLTLIRILVSTIVLFVAVLALGGINNVRGLHEGFFPILFLSGFLNATALYFQVRALKLSDASLVVPIQLLTPVILLATSPIMIGQQVTRMGAVGVVIIVLGAYFMGLTKEAIMGRKFFAPLLLLFRDKGVRSMCVTALIWGVTSNLDRIGVGKSSPLLWSFSTCTIMSIVTFGFWAYFKKDSITITKGELRQAVMPGVANAASTLLQMYAITLLPVPYVLALKRTSAIASVVLGGIIFHEEIGMRFIGCGVMLAGVVLIAFSL